MINAEQAQIETEHVRIKHLYDYGGYTCGKKELTDFHSNVLSGIVYCVDCADTNRFEEAKETLKEIMEIEQVKNVPIVILGTHCDKLKDGQVGNLEKVLEIEEKLGDRFNNPELERSMKLFYCTISRKESWIDPFKVSF